MLFYEFLYRWKIAIKTNRVIDSSVIRCTNRSRNAYSESGEGDMNEVSSLMDEAKTMWKVGSYHENIVNLQGITVGVEDESIRRVCIFSHFDCYHTIVLLIYVNCSNILF